MRKVMEVIVVEGRYDKSKVAQAVDATVIETSGFQILSDEEKLTMLRKLAEKRGLIILTDSDSAGFLIRGHLKGMLGTGVKHAYIPDVKGREKRKRTPSSEGKLGVEGMSSEVIISALERAGATFYKFPLKKS
jgi:ribonuclease M5